MSQHAVEILKRWIAEAVRAVPAEETAREAARLSVEFSAYAEDAGLKVQELELDIGQDLPSFMKDAIEAAREEEGLLAEEE